MDNKQIDALIALRDLISKVIDGEQLEAISSSGEWVSRDARQLLEWFGGRFFNNVKPEEWRTVPQPKVIDLSCLVGSDVLCEFWRADGGRPEARDVGFLIGIEIEGITWKITYMSNNGETWNCCQPSTMVQAWQGGECPLPEGVKYDYQTRVSGFPGSWVRLRGSTRSDIIQYQVTGTLEGYILPHEVEK